MRAGFRCWLTVVCSLVLWALLLTAPAMAAQITDLRGRNVELPDGPSRITIDDARLLIALALVTPDPVAPLVAWSQDTRRLGEPMYEAFVQRFPALADLPKVASSADAFNMEAVLAAAPDVAVVSLGSGPSDTQIRQLQAAGIAVVFVDFYAGPAENQVPSLRILGQLVGGQAQAEAFLAFREQHLQRIRERVADLPKDERPTVFVEAHAGMTKDCCNSPGTGTVNDYIQLVGGHNIGADVLRTPTGKLNLEYVISRDPEVYIATGGAYLEKAGGLVLGEGYSAGEARASLQAISQRRGISGLGAVRSGNAHALAQQFIHSPLDLVALEAMATWVHPALFHDVDPARTLAQINQRFLAVPYEGAGWISLQAPESQP